PPLCHQCRTRQEPPDAVADGDGADTRISARPAAAAPGRLRHPVRKSAGSARGTDQPAHPPRGAAARHAPPRSGRHVGVCPALPARRPAPADPSCPAHAGRRHARPAARPVGAYRRASRSTAGAGRVDPARRMSPGLKPRPEPAQRLCAPHTQPLRFRMRTCVFAFAHRAALAIATGLLTAGLAVAQPYPGKPVRLIVPFPPGGPTDVASRLVGQQLEARLQQPVIVENRPGASGSIAANQLKRAAPDGYTLMMLATPTLFAPFFYKNVGYETPKDFQPVATVYDLPIVVVVNPQSLPQVHTLAELVDYAKARPGELNYASSGAGSFGHVTMELLQDVGGFKMQHVAYKGGVPAITDTIGGQVPMM